VVLGFWALGIVMVAMILPFLLLMFVGFMAVSTKIPLNSNAMFPSNSGYSPENPGGSAFASDFVSLSKAALAYTENNPGVSGPLTAAQLGPYMGNNAFPPYWGASVQNGLVYAWTNSGGYAITSEIQNLTDGDCAYGSVENGQIVSSSKNCPGAVLGVSPTSLSNGTPIWTIAVPHN